MKDAILYMTMRKSFGFFISCTLQPSVSENLKITFERALFISGRANSYPS
jgi:hypothetical protein